ncbi:MAG: hypothetical protein JKY08_08940 [Flavobacteriaceae bacterium]|nr:hypothetical protein [Flavobacteriaceae bacterium]
MIKWKESSKRVSVWMIALLFLFGAEHDLFAHNNGIPPTEKDKVDSITLCISAIFIELCYTWELEESSVIDIDQGEVTDLLNNLEGDNFEVTTNEKYSYLTIKGFDKKLDGLYLKGKSQQLSKRYRTSAGKFVIKNGEMRVPLLKTFYRKMRR